MCLLFFFFKQMTAYGMRISDWSSDVCSSDLYSGLLERSAAIIRKPGLALATTTPCWTTSDGRRGVASATLFCTCTWAMSGSVPGLKVSVIEARPLVLDEEMK